MGFLSDFKRSMKNAKGEVTKPDAPIEMEGLYFAREDGMKAIRVVGNSSGQGGLSKITSHSGSVKVDYGSIAILMPAPENGEPGVPFSLQVQMNGVAVGHLDQPEAERYRAAVEALLPVGRLIACDTNAGAATSSPTQIYLPAPDEILEQVPGTVAPPPSPNRPPDQQHEVQEPVKTSTGRPGNYQGRHFTKYVDEVKALEKAGRQDEAVALLLHLVDATEAECAVDGLGVAPWYYERLAIIYRKQRRPEDEIAILERFARQQHALGASPPKLLLRLDKLQGKIEAPSNKPNKPASTPSKSPTSKPSPDISRPIQRKTDRRATAEREFLAIDFETACGSRASACAVGYAKFSDGQLVATGETLIDPGLSAHEWDAFNTSIHGITPDDVVGAPSFIDVWQVIQDRHGEIPLIAHNAAFDMSVIRAELARVGYAPDKPFQYACSATLARAAWPDMVSVSLGIVADRLGIELDHHNAKSDAVASGSIAVEAARALECTTVGDALAKVSREWGWVNPDLTWDTGHRHIGAAEFTPAEDCDPNHPYYGKIIVFTGTLQSMSRREAFTALSKVGGTPGNSVTRKTSILVVGQQDLARLASGDTTSNKMKKAAGLRASGCDIEIVGEAEFRERL